MKNKSNSLTKYWSGQQFIGLSVFDSKENDCGKIQSLCIDIQTFSISGVMVKKRLSSEYFLSVTYFENLSESSLKLNSIPIKPNDKIVDVDGKSMGKVIKINLDSKTNKIESLEIKYMFKSKIIPSDRIVGVGDKITIKA
ncbi:MAG: PRC-barrel domain-containing protein [Candidatus Nitrosopumilus sp. Bin_571-38]